MRLIAFVILFTYASFHYAQKQQQYKYGKIDISELEMLLYEQDTAATAVVLFHDGFTDYDFVNNNFQVKTFVKKRIKILKQEGVDNATVNLRYYFKTASLSENITDLEAFAYNLENGKITKTKLDKKYIFNEKLNDNYRQIKFAIPNVKAGTVIEYKYLVTSVFYHDIPNWYFQSEIPVLNASYEVIIPEYFNYSIETRGFETIITNEKSINKNFTINVNKSLETVRCNARNIIFTIESIPALKNDDYVWAIRDFLSSIRFELNGTSFPFELYKSYSRTWEDIDKTLKDNSNFATYTNRPNPFRKEKDNIYSSEDTEIEKIEKIYQFVKEKIRWNGTYGFASNPSEAIKDGAGNNAQINSILISMLKDAGMNAYPVMLSRRSLGRLPFTYPSIDQLNTYIVMAVTTSGERYYLDGSAYYGGLNMLPTDLLVDKARIYGTDVHDKWVDLTSISKNQILSSIFVRIKPDGSLEGKCNRIMMFQPAYSFKKMYHELKDSSEIIDKLKLELSVEIDSLKLEGQQSLLSNRVIQKFNFSKTFDGDSEHLYINPLIFSHITNNDFTQSERKLPVEFTYPYRFMISTSIEIPDNYCIEELPQSAKIILNNNDGNLVYLIKKVNEKLLQISYRFELLSTIFPYSDYEAIKSFWGQVASKNNELIVLKRI